MTEGIARAEPDWVRHAIWWHVYPLGATGADASGVDRQPVHWLARVEEWLDYAIELGASGLMLGPIFEASTHGYDTVDHYRIDQRLGDDSDFDELVAQAHRRGLRVLLDGVFNHVGREFPGVQEVLAEGRSADRAGWFRLADGSAEGPVTLETFEGHDALVTLNHDEPAVADYVVDVMRHWLDRGVDGWRLDAAYAVPARFWASVLPRVRADHGDAYIFGEWIHGDYAAAVADSTVDSLTQYELWKALWSSLNDANLYELEWAMQRHNEWLDTFVPVTFAGNHDVTRLASRLEDPRHLAHALVVLMTVGGTPAVYYGDEQGFLGVKEERVGGDDEVRPPLPPVPADLDPGGRSTYRLHQELIGLRRRNPWLHDARTETVQLANESFVYDVSGADDRLRVCLNLSEQPLDVDLAECEKVAGDVQIREGGAVVPGGGWAVLRAG